MEFNNETLMLIGGLLLVVIIAFIAVGFYRRSGRSDEIKQGSRTGLPSSAEQNKSLDFLEGSARVPSEMVPGADRAGGPALRDSRIPLSDVTPDLETRPTGSAPVSAPARPHTLDEIQRHEPRELSSALANTKSSFFNRLKLVFSKKELMQAGEMEELEEILYTSDLGPQTVQRLLSAVEEKIRANGGSGFEAVRDALRAEMMAIFDSLEAPKSNGGSAPKVNGANGHANGGKHDAERAESDSLEFRKQIAVDRAIVAHAGHDYIEGLEHLNIWNHKPAVLLVVGVNGAGKTTTIGKLARRIAQSGRKVLVAAGDTFRAAAGDQLKVWTERAQVEIHSPANVSDPSAVAFDAVQTGAAKGFDVVIIDTAGRLHTAKNLMEELKKMQRVIKKQMPEAPHETLLVLDANNGQNALVQAKEFHQAINVTGVVLTKLDGTAKGGVAVGLACELGLPIKLIGVGEKIEDLREFNSREFVNSII